MHIGFYSIHTPEILSDFFQWPPAESRSLSQSSCLVTSWSHLHRWPLAHELTFLFCLAPPNLSLLFSLPLRYSLKVCPGFCMLWVGPSTSLSFVYLLIGPYLLCQAHILPPQQAALRLHCTNAAQLVKQVRLIHASLPLFPELGIPSLVLSSKLVLIVPLTLSYLFLWRMVFPNSAA